MGREQQSARDIFFGALSRKSRMVPPLEIRDFILRAARDNGHALTESGDLDVFEIGFSTEETISLDGHEWHFEKRQ